MALKSQKSLGHGVGPEGRSAAKRRIERIFVFVRLTGKRVKTAP